MAAIGPTGLAGGCFPVIVVLIYFLIGTVVVVFTVTVGTTSIDGELLSDSLGAIIGVLVFSVLGFVGGSIYAAMFAAAFSTVMIMFHWTTNQRFHPRILSQLVGGMTGFWCVAVFGMLNNSTDLAWLAGVVGTAIFAMMVGQYGAARGYRAMYRHYQRESNRNDLQFGIRDLMVGMTWSAVLMALFAAAPGKSIVVFVCWVLAQSASLAVGASIRRYRTNSGRKTAV